jgi:hypothetical protein
MQRACHPYRRWTLAVFALTLGASAPLHAESPANDYPTQARVEYVNECIVKNGGKLSQVYQCSCVIDRIANTLTYDAFVEASTIVKYSTLPGEGGGIFRDPEEGQRKAKQLRELEQRAYRECGLES